MGTIGTVTCPPCVRRVVAHDGKFDTHWNVREGKRCERSGTEARDVHPVREPSRR